MRLTHRLTARDESGNMIVAMAVLMVVTLLSMAVFVRTLSGLHSSRQGQDFAAALGQADAGLSDATFRMDQLGSTPASTFCVGPSPSCAVTSLPGAPNVSYVAQRVDDNTFTVLSKGLVNGQPHGIKATVTRSQLFPFAIFAASSATFNGSSDDSVVATAVRFRSSRIEVAKTNLRPGQSDVELGQAVRHLRRFQAVVDGAVESRDHSCRSAGRRQNAGPERQR